MTGLGLGIEAIWRDKFSSSDNPNRLEERIGMANHFHLSLTIDTLRAYPAISRYIYFLLMFSYIARL
jgi:hypothetical protein